MSYVFNIWDPHQIPLSTPKNLQEVWLTLQKLESEESVLGSQFTQLEKQLNSDLFEGDLEQELIIAREQKTSIWTISPAHSYMRALHELVRLAQPLGLSVFDGQVGLYFDPQHGLLPKDMGEYWHAVLHQLSNENLSKSTDDQDWSLIKKTLLNIFTQRLKNLGFDQLKKLQGIHYQSTCVTSEGGQQILLSIHESKTWDGKKTGLSISVSLNSFNSEIRKICADLGFWYGITLDLLSASIHNA